jgi:hypothetical protein
MRRMRCQRALLSLALAAQAACGRGSSPAAEPAWFRAGPWNSGPEPYSAWFADSDGRILYFGLSPFWTLWWETAEDPRADLREPGDHLIGRFDLERGRFLPPLLVRRRGPGSRGSVWDVLVHRNGRIYYTTYFEEIGSVAPDGSDVRHFAGLGAGWNELVEGPGGLVYATRYSDSPEDPGAQRRGSVGVLSPEGALLRELPIEPDRGRFRAPKSLAVDPASGEIWVNVDAFSSDGSVSYEALRLSPGGEVLGTWPAPPELQFAAFDASGRGWFAEAERAELRLRVVAGGREIAATSLGARRPVDFVQDIRFGPDGAAILASWAGRAFVARLEGEELRVREVRFALPPDCAPPRGRSLLYTAVFARGSLYATLFCRATILRADAD